MHNFQLRYCHLFVSEPDGGEQTLDGIGFCVIYCTLDDRKLWRMSHTQYNQVYQALIKDLLGSKASPE